MKQLVQKTMGICALVSAFCLTSMSSAHILMRSQSVDSARELAGWAHKVNLFNADENGWYGTFAVTGEYAQSFRSGRIADCLFGDNITHLCDDDLSCAQVNVSGSRVTNRGSNSLLADYFGLPTDYESVFSVKPRVRSFIVDFDFYAGLDRWMCGAWFRIHAPIVYTNWKLNLHETVVNPGSNPYVEGYFSPVAVARENLNASFSEYLVGSVPEITGDDTFSPVFQPLAHALVSGSSYAPGYNPACGLFCDGKGVHTTKLSDIQAALGWNFWQNEDYHVGLGARISIPTGTRINDAYLFQPIVGNGHHFEVGGMFTSHWTFWRGCDEDRSMGVYVDANVTHLFATKQCRSFNLCGRGDNSRYMLAMNLNSLGRTPTGDFAGYALTGNPEGALPPAYVAPVLVDGYTRAEAAFGEIFAPVANIAYGAVDVSIPVQADLTIMFNYQNCGFEFDFGYNLWATTCEQINFIDNCPIVPSNTWALKGDAHVYGFDIVPGGDVDPVPLSGTQSEATIYTGTNFVTPNSIAQGQTNIGVDNRQFAYGDSTDVNSTLIPGRTLFVSTTVPQPAVLAQTNTSIQPVFLSDCDLDIAGARERGLTNKLFTNLSYTWEEQCLAPYFGIGAKLEFAGSNNGLCNSGCGTTSCASICAQVNSCTLGCNDDCGDSCSRCNISEWGLWLKGGISF